MLISCVRSRPFALCLSSTNRRPYGNSLSVERSSREPCASFRCPTNSPDIRQILTPLDRCAGHPSELDSLAVEHIAVHYWPPLEIADPDYLPSHCPSWTIRLRAAGRDTSWPPSSRRLAQ